MLSYALLLMLSADGSQPMIYYGACLLTGAVFFVWIGLDALRLARSHALTRALTHARTHAQAHTRTYTHLHARRYGGGVHSGLVACLGGPAQYLCTRAQSMYKVLSSCLHFCTARS
eukprot:3488099-Pleurochrysis_carterae.AAC.1